MSRVVAGEKANRLETAVTITVTSEDTKFPKANLYDGWPGYPFRFNAAAANDAITIDTAFFNGAMESWSGGTPSGWTELDTGAGVVEEVTGGDARTGSAARVKQSTGSAQLYRDIQVRSGEWVQLDAWLKRGGSGTARLRIQNRDTGRYLQGSDQTWQSSASTDAASELTATTYQNKTVLFQVESAAVCMKAVVTLRVILTSTGTGASDYGFFDDIYLWPGKTDWCSIHGHNINAVIAAELRSSTDNFSASNTLEATLTKAQPGFWARLTTPVTRRYWRVLFSGTNTVAIEIGELVLAQHLNLAREPDAPITLTREDRAIESDAQVFALSDHPDLGIVLSFSYLSQAQYIEARDEIVARCRGKRFPIIVAYDDAGEESDLVIHGRLGERWEIARASKAPKVREGDLIVVPNPFAVPVA